MLVAAAGSFSHDGTAGDLLRQWGRVSELTSIKYWSISDQRWQKLVTDAFALSDPDPTSRRADFTLAELVPRADLYFAQDDNRSTGTIVYALHIREVEPHRLVIETENVTSVRYLVVPLAGSGQLQSAFFFERLSPPLWGFYSLARTGAETSPFTSGHEASYINRATAYFRYFAGLPTDLEPPAAP
jgi:hypothetical protein